MLRGRHPRRPRPTPTSPRCAATGRCCGWPATRPRPSSGWSPTTPAPPRRVRGRDQLPARRPGDPPRAPTPTRRPTSRAWPGTGTSSGRSGRTACAAAGSRPGTAGEQGPPPAGQGRPARPTARCWSASPCREVDGLPDPRSRSSSSTAPRTRPRPSAPTAPTCGDLLADDVHVAPFVPIPEQGQRAGHRGDRRRGRTGLPGPARTGAARVGRRPGAAPGRRPRRRSTGSCCVRSRTAASYRKHLLRLGGLGVRDLCPHGQDLLVLAGPTMDLDGPVHVFRWHGALAAEHPAGRAGRDADPRTRPALRGRRPTTRRASG